MNFARPGRGEVFIVFSGLCMDRSILLASLLVAGAALTPVHAEETEVLHYWTSGSEAAALARIAEAFEAKGGVWKDLPVAGFEAERTVAMTRFAGGTPPAAMLTELGQETNKLAEAGVLRDLTEIATAENWDAVLPRPVADAVKVDGAFFAVPVDIGGRNWMYTSPKVLAEAGVAAPTTWEEFFPAAEAIKAKGHIPLALGGESWQEAILFSAVLAGVGGNDFFKAIYEDADADAARSDKMVEVFDTFRRLGGYVDPGSPGRAWNDTTNLVITDQAGMIIMGDWAKGEFVSAGKTAGADFGCALAPGTAHFYDAIVDAFVFPTVKGDASAQDMLIATMMDPATQVAFNRVKGSLPPRSDADTAALDACAVLGATTMADPETYVPAIASRPTNDVSGQLEDIVSGFWNDPAMTSADAAEAYAAVLESVE